MNKVSLRNIILIWLAWVFIVIGFQALATARFQVQWPDRAQQWTEDFTGPNYQKGHVYLTDPFMNDQVAWDSEYYLGIATGGYNDPYTPHLTPFGVVTFDYHTLTANNRYAGQNLSLSYAFFPLYSWMIWLVAWPIKLFGMDPVATSTLAGVIVSALGTLGAMLALYDLTKDSLGEDGAMRAVFYLLIFPTGFFLVQVYTEGLFVGLAFGALAMLKRRQWILTALFAVAATLTRAVGVSLVIPMAITWIRSGEWMDLDLEWRQIYQQGIPWRILGKALLAFSPLIVFLIWKFSYLGLAFDYVESNYFGRGVLDLGYGFYAWSEAFKSMFIGNPERTAYFLTEFIGLVVGIVTCVACLRYEPELAWFSIAVFLISWGSGPAQGIQRYILGAPAVFIMLARWGKNQVFDRAWTMFSLLLMGLEAMLFAFNYWVA
ncbi:MAG TPA: hypothetical protein VMT73_13860 [Anaerolineales bacterium]|nr:hypothetical protein [Anaerolineales bacterium]